MFKVQQAGTDFYSVCLGIVNSWVIHYKYNMAVSVAWLKHERHRPKGEASCKAKSHVTNTQYPEGVVYVQTCPVNAYPSTSRRQTPLVFTCPQGSAILKLKVQ